MGFIKFTNHKLANYIENHSQGEDSLLRKINRETNLEVLNPRMLSGHLQGRVLSILTKMIRPKNILEIGTYTGYSALCMAEGLNESGKIITIDNNKELKNKVESYFNESKYGKQIEYRIGDALKVIPTLIEKFDLVFIDADKINYLNYYTLLIEKLPAGAFIIADNVLWSGKVIEPLKNNDIDTQSLLDFNAKIQADRRVENVLFPIRDGLMIIRKI